MSPKGKINVEHIRHNGARERLFFFFFFLLLWQLNVLCVCLCKSDHNSCWHNCIAATSVSQTHTHTHVRTHEHTLTQSQRSLWICGLLACRLAGFCLPFSPDRLLHTTWSNKDKHMLGRLLEKYQGLHSGAASAPLCSERGGTL